MKILTIVWNTVTSTKKEISMTQIAMGARKFAKNVKRAIIWMTTTNARRCPITVMNVTNMENANLV